MIRFLQNLRFETISFWAGFAAATLLWWVIKFARPVHKKFFSWIKGKYEGWRKTRRLGFERKYYDSFFEFTQGQHLSSPLFSLEEILITPRFLGPPPIIDPDLPPYHEEIITELIPYTPDWPELASAYHYKTLNVLDTVKHVDRIAITGNPGSGKTTTLFYISTHLFRDNIEGRELHEFIPLYIHISDLTILPDQEIYNPLPSILDAITNQLPKLSPSRLENLIKTKFNQGRVILLLDGLDEAFPHEMKLGIIFLKSISQQYPKIKIIVTASESYLDELPGLGFSFLTLALWASPNQEALFERWKYLWLNFIDNLEVDKKGSTIDPSLIHGWVVNQESAVRPMDFTLKLWSAFAGDSLGPNLIHDLDAYIRRTSNASTKIEAALSIIATITAVNSNSTFLEKEARKWLSEAKKEAASTKKSSLSENEEHNQELELDYRSRTFQELVEIGLLKLCSGKKLKYIHPSVFAYFAAKSVPPEVINTLFNQPVSGINKSIRLFLSYQPALDEYINSALHKSEDPLLRDRLFLARWLPNILHEPIIKNKILNQIIHDIQNEILPKSLKFRLFSALIFSQVSTTPDILRELVNSNDSTISLLAVLGIGYINDTQSIELIKSKLNGPLPVKQSACFALLKIGTQQAFEAVVTALLSGDQQLAFASAEAFASHPSKGHQALRESSTVDDILVRRAAIFGLRKINEPWAVEILETMQIDDPQWVIKDAAMQAIKDRSEPDSSIPVKQPQLEDIPWLVAFAAERGIGIGPGKPAQNMLFRVIKEGKEEEILAALDQLKIRGETNIFPHIYPLFYNENNRISDSAYTLLWQVASMGIKIPTLEEVSSVYKPLGELIS